MFYEGIRVGPKGPRVPSDSKESDIVPPRNTDIYNSSREFTLFAQTSIYNKPQNMSKHKLNHPGRPPKHPFIFNGPPLIKMTGSVTLLSAAALPTADFQNLINGALKIREAVCGNKFRKSRFRFLAYRGGAEYRARYSNISTKWNGELLCARYSQTHLR
jgi:hypothetical protein